MLQEERIRLIALMASSIMIEMNTRTNQSVFVSWSEAMRIAYDRLNEVERFTNPSTGGR